MGIARVVNGKTGSNRFISLSIFIPRTWKIMILAAYPFLLLATNCFEELERTGTLGAFIADILLPATIICYVALILALKKRSI